MTRVDLPRGSWDFRRRMSVRALQFCAGIIVVSLLSPFVNPDIAKTAIVSAFTLAGTIIGAYLGVATVNDHLSRPRPVATTPMVVKPPVVAKDEEIG